MENKDKINVIMREDNYYDNMNIILLPKNIFDIEGYSSRNIDNTSLIDEYIRQSMSGVQNGTAIELFINYGFTRALVSTLNVIFEKKLDCGIHIYNDDIHDYMEFGRLKKYNKINKATDNTFAASFQLINRKWKKTLEASVQPVFSGGQIDVSHMFDADYMNQIAYDVLKDYAGKKVYLYITGLKQALIACVNAARELDIQMTLKHYNPDDESYEHIQNLYIG